MGIFHSRSKKKRNEAEAAYFNEMTRQAKDARQREDTARREQAAGDNPWRQPTVGGAISTWRRNRQQG
jgi:hypothetical protein